MIKKLYIHQYTWERGTDEISISFDKEKGSSEIFLGTIDLTLPDDLIPDDEVWNALVQDSRLEYAKSRVVETQVAHESAKEDLKELTALPSPTL
jgi:hypothetical protein